MRRPLPFAVLVAGCAVVGAVMGAGAAALARPADAVRRPPLPVVAEVEPDALQRPQRAVDVAQVPPTAGISRSSLRLLVSLPPATELLAARRPGGDVCLLALAIDHGTWRAACVPRPTFAAKGVGLTWSFPGSPRQRGASWTPDGAVRAGTPRPQ